MNKRLRLCALFGKKDEAFKRLDAAELMSMRKPDISDKPDISPKDLPGRGKGRRILRRCLMVSGILLVAVSVGAYWVATFVAGTPESRPEVLKTPVGRQPSESTDSLRLLTLNIAHGRGDGFHQLLQSRKTIRANLDEIAEVIRRDNPDVVALQEADGPSSWSGNFNHVEYLASQSGNRYFLRGEHVKGLGLSYGTALLAQRKLLEPLSITFAPSPPTFTKGFVVSTIEWRSSPPGDDPRFLDIVSVHLDFARRSVRVSQAREIIEHLRLRTHHLIILGDFNCDWADEESALHRIAGELELRAYRPGDTGLETFPLTGDRFDWILISSGLAFRKCITLSDRLSDHRGVLAEIVLEKDF